MNPYAIIVGLVMWGASLGGAFWFGASYEKGQQAREDVLIDKAVAKFQQAGQAWTDDLALSIATGFSGITVKNTIINNEVRHEREVQTRILDNPDCIVPASVVRLLNSARGYGTDGPSAGPAEAGVPTDGKTSGPAPGR